MLKKFSLKSTLLILTTLFLITSCEKDDDPVKTTSSDGPYHNGVFITNEGSYLNNNGSISFYATSNDDTYDIVADSVYNNIFSTVNGRSLGDVVQSITLSDSLAYIVVNNSNKVEVVTSVNFKEKNVITGVNLPRYLVVNGTTAYISAWGDGGVVYAVDLSTYTVIKTIAVGNGPEKMLIDGDKLYVSNSGGYVSDSTVMIIDLNTNEKVDSIIVGGNPKSIVKDKNGDKWVLCNGIVEYDPVDYHVTRETPSQLVKLNSNDEVEKTVQIATTEHPSVLDINPSGDILYFGGGYSFIGIKSYSILSTADEFNDISSDFAYGFMVDSNTGELFEFLAPSFTDNGILNRLNSEGTLIKSYTLGIGPNGGASTKKAVVQ